MRDYFSVQLSLAPWWRWWYSAVKISTKTKSNMKICASFSYQWGLEICPTEISKQLFLIKINFSISDNSKSPSLFTSIYIYKKIRLPTPEEMFLKICIANFLRFCNSQSESCSVFHHRTLTRSGEDVLPEPPKHHEDRRSQYVADARSFMPLNVKIEIKAPEAPFYCVDAIKTL